jgi:gluconokinase
VAQAIVVMGVSGCGKTSVGAGLSAALGWPFFDGDDFHSQENIDKMAAGIPLGDADRQPWLESLHRLMEYHLAEGRPLIVACSALKASYRQTLRGDLESVRFVHLAGSFELIQARLERRSAHYMKAALLRSQFAALEPPMDAITVSIEKPIEEIFAEIIGQLHLPK